MVVTVRKLLASELDWANACYADIQFLPSSAMDLVAVAEVDGEMAGLGRLVSIDGTTGELGGMYVPPAFRGRHVATAIVSYLLQHSPYERLFCIPFTHLANFYAEFGFQPVPTRTAVPAAVAEKVGWCEKEYPAKVQLLLRTAHGADSTVRSEYRNSLLN